MKTGVLQLSILIATTPERQEKFTILYNELMRQKTAFDTTHDSLGCLEIVVNAGARFLDGGLSIGKKREALVNEASGEYLCFLDDDESIAPNYIESLMRLCYQDMDVCTFRAFVKMENFWALVDMRLMYNVNDQLNPDYTTRRPPWHMCPVKSKYAKIYGFPDVNAAEDFEWMKKVLKLCTTEAHTDKIIFQYNHTGGSQSDEVTKLGYA